MNLPPGDLLRSRVADSPREPLAAALDRSLTGYAVLEPADSLLGDGGVRGVLAFEDGVPTLAYVRSTGRAGPAAVADLAEPGPVGVELYELPPAALAAVDADDSLRLAPDDPALELADDPALAARTRERAPAADREDRSALEAFLADETRIADIRAEARSEARARAEEWGLADAVVDGEGDPGSGGAGAFVDDSRADRTGDAEVAAVEGTDDIAGSAATMPSGEHRDSGPD